MLINVDQCIRKCIRFQVCCQSGSTLLIVCMRFSCSAFGFFFYGRYCSLCVWNVFCVPERLRFINELHGGIVDEKWKCAIYYSFHKYHLFFLSSLSTRSTTHIHLIKSNQIDSALLIAISCWCHWFIQYRDIVRFRIYWINHWNSKHITNVICCASVRCACFFFLSSFYSSFQLFKSSIIKIRVSVGNANTPTNPLPQRITLYQSANLYNS